jgi:hypothetical protein
MSLLDHTKRYLIKNASGRLHCLACLGQGRFRGIAWIAECGPIRCEHGRVIGHLVELRVQLRASAIDWHSALQYLVVEAGDGPCVARRLGARTHHQVDRHLQAP